MKYDPSDEISRQKAITRFKYFLDKGIVFELTKFTPSKTVPQLKYVHVLFRLYAIHFGHTAEYSKKFLKLQCDFMTEYFEKVLTFRSCADLDKTEMTNLIESIRTFSSLQGCYLPTPEQYRLERYYFDNQIEIHAKYL